MRKKRQKIEYSVRDFENHFKIYRVRGGGCMLPAWVVGDLRRDRQFQGDDISRVACRADPGGGLCMPGIHAGLYAP